MSEAALMKELFVGLLAQFHIGCSFGEHGVIDASNFMSGGVDRLLAAVAGFTAAIKGPERGLAAGQTGGGQTKGLGSSVSFALDLFAECFATGAAGTRAHAQ